MKQAWNDLKSFITVAMILILAGVIIADICGFALSDNLLLLFTNLATSIFTYYFTKKNSTDDTAESEETDEDK